MFADTALQFIEYLKQNGFLQKEKGFVIELKDYPVAENLVKNIEVYNNFLQDKLPRYCVVENKRIAIQTIEMEYPTNMKFKLAVFVNEGTSAKNIFFTYASLSDITHVISDEVFEIMLNIIKEDLDEIVEQQNKLLSSSGFGEF